MPTRSRGPAARLYAALLWLLPPVVRREDGAEMRAVFDELWAERRRGRERFVLGVRLFGRVPWVAALEWMDLMGWTGTNTTGGWEMGGWGKHLRFAQRTLRKSPGFAVTTVLLIALGVGAVTTIFTLVDHVLLRPLPYPAPDRLVTVQNGAHSGVVFRELQALDGVESWVAGTVNDANLTGEGDPVRIQQATVSEGFFSFFGARPAVGRLLVDDDFRSADAVVVSAQAWRSLFGEDPSVVGRTLRVDGEPVVVVGVLDRDFEAPQSIVGAAPDLLRPIDWSNEDFARVGYHTLNVAGRLAPAVPFADVQRQLDDLAERLGREHPAQRVNREGVVDPLPLAGLQDASVDRIRTGLNLLLGAVGLLLLVACLNVAHLFLARGLSRVQEMAVRRALGAGAGGLAQQLFVESLLIGLAGGALGLALAYGGLEGLLAINPYPIPRLESVSLDLRVAAFAGGVSVLTAVLFGLLPALRTAGGDLTNELKGSSRGSTTGRGTQRLRGGLVVAEVALSLVLVAQAGLLLKSFLQARALDPGFEAEAVWTIPLTPTGIETPQDYVLAMDEVLTSLQALPGVEAAAYGLTQPFEFTGGGRCCWSQSRVEIDGQAYEGIRMMMQPVSTDYFATLGIELLTGGVWTSASEAERPLPAVVSERLAIDAFGSADAAMGRVIGAPDRLQVRVVGVAADNKHYGLDQPFPQSAYVPIAALPFTIPRAHMAVRIGGEEPVGLARTLREAVWAVAPDMPVPTVRPMTEWMAEAMASRRFESVMFGAFGVVALLLAAAGLYGTLLYNVRQQSRELGIRLALGAARGRVEREVVGRGFRLALVGALLGGVGAVWAGGLLESRLYEVQGGDPVAVGGAAAVLLLSAVVASWLPARRAGRTDPIQTLKAE